MANPFTKVQVRAGFLQVHRWLGLTLGLVLAVMGLTGATMAFEDPIMAALSPGAASVPVRSAPTLSPDVLLERFARAVPDASVTTLTLRSKPGASPQVSFTDAAEPGGHARKLYLNPYTGDVLGAATGEEFFATVRRLHRYLLLPGDGKGWGRQITGAAAISLIFFALSGLYLRWPKRLLDWKVWLKPNLKAKRRGLYWSLHAVIGTWVFVVYLVIALTGLTWSYDWYRKGFQIALTGAAPPAQEAAGPRAPAGPVSLDKAYVAARPGGETPKLVLLSVPRSSKAPVRVRTLASDAAHDRAFDEWRIDGRTGEVREYRAYAARSLGEQIVQARFAVHRGSFFGLPGQIVFMLAAATMPLFPITGYLLYLGRGRRPVRAKPAAAALKPKVS